MRRGVLTAVVATLIAGCGGDGGGSAPPPVLKITGVVMTAGGYTVVDVNVDKDGLPVSTAAVDVNGTDIPWDGSSYYFSGALALSGGDGVTLTVTDAESGLSASETGTMPGEPAVTDPNTAGSPYDASSSLAVKWLAVSPTPDGIAVMADSSITASGETWSAEVDGTATQAVIPGGTLLGSLSDAYIAVTALTASTSFAGDAADTSLLGLGNIGFSEPFSTQ